MSVVWHLEGHGLIPWSKGLEHVELYYFLLTDSDEESETQFIAKRQKVIQYGSLEQKEKQRLAGASEGSLAGDAIKAGVAAGNINISSGK